MPADYVAKHYFFWCGAAQKKYNINISASTRSKFMRPYCHHCTYPQKTCLCHVISPVNNNIPIRVLQHKKETHHALNTIRIATLCLQNIDVRHFPMEAEECALWLDGSALLFPCHRSQELPKEHNGPLCILDATWPKAKGMYLSMPFLQTLPCYHLPSPPQSSYVIRKAPHRTSLSSLEAIAAALEYLHEEKSSVQPLYDAFHARLMMQIQHIPPSVFQKNYRL